MSLTKMQKRYIWLAGSYPTLAVVQGRGKRTAKLWYAVTDDELVLFGYSNPMLWLCQRDLFRPLQARNHFTLTGAGEMIFEQLKASGGMLNDNFSPCKVKPSQPA